MKNVDFAWISPKSHREFRQDSIYSFENDTIKCTQFRTTSLSYFYSVRSSTVGGPTKQMADKGKQKVHDESESTRDSGMEALARVLERLIVKNEREDGIDEKKVDLIVKAVKPFPQNREEVCRWFDILEPVIKTMCVNDATKYTALVTLLGGERFSQVSMEAQNKGQEPEATYIWLKEQVVATFSKKRTVRSLMKQILARRLD